MSRREPVDCTILLTDHGLDVVDVRSIARVAQIGTRSEMAQLLEKLTVDPVEVVVREEIEPGEVAS